MNVLVCSTPDSASVNLKNAILSDDWIDYADFHGSSAFLKDNLLLLTIKEHHVFYDDLDKEIVKELGVIADNIIFLSKHKSASEKKALTVHPIGNWADAKLGGKDNELTPSSPHLMSALLRSIKKSAAHLPDYDVVFEVTHHGPLLETPTLFMEIGSTESEWSNTDASAALASALFSATENKSYPIAVGIGGGHYAPRFTETAISKKLDFGHMIPNYAIDFNDAEKLSSMVNKAMENSNTDLVFVHRKSMKKEQADVVKRAIDNAGASLIDSSSLELID
ncbi:hypothetical protein A3206_07580 [Candidatus Methanomassiliicoccus intestinalis]|uniref:D-aminoacyl-tRNA deacylase n=1 Tax=Methanomassiliicoccus intestinalis (strain Issoire-Mx1) TaxID=1295009 RepID=R9T8L5_METII|nr:D-aminoacyl-tRNA deacylase [Candidatus Methanomassiliicoccus intestinalis]AGN25683.1 hypothetical protein MMINT_02850 [Candidatus Methanomassiliicoccus intestinalis Issoire-Mx1]TQS82806.1 MAG: hypothetical protein A3206_07580 [Candidatus Methanomassiliicoccus intestinalis]